jgi:glycosyltransferase involved in cell wall biosynthesis
LEAFSFGLPVLAANNSCLPEIGGGAILEFDPFNEIDIFNKMKEVIENNELRKELKEAGRKRLEFFSWKKAATELVGVFDKTVHT